MLRLIVPGDEYFNEETEEFETVGDVELLLEHSLISLSKWESKHLKPFLAKNDKTSEEILSYVEAMIVSPSYPSNVFSRFSQENLHSINDYIDSKYSATSFGHLPEHRGSGETITSELIYYWMVALNIPFEVEYWHLNRLFALIRICNVKNSKSKKMPRHEIAARNRELNAQRRAQLGTSG